MEYRKPQELKPHPISIELYGDNHIDDIKDSIAKFGILVPLIITSGNIIISGHRRWRCAIELGIDSVPIEVKSFANELEEKRSILEFNQQREKTTSQKIKEAKLLKVIISEEARIRQRATQFGNHGGANIGGTDTERKTADIVGKATGIGGRTTFHKAEELYDKAQEGNAIAQKLLDELDAEEETIEGAYKRLQISEKGSELVQILQSSNKFDVSTAYQISAIENQQKQDELAQLINTKHLPITVIRELIPRVKADMDRPAQDIYDDILTGKAQTDDAIRLEIAKNTAGIIAETSEELERAGKQLLEEAKRKAEEALTAEVKAKQEAEKAAKKVAQKAERERRKREREEKAKEKAEKMSLEEIEAIADKVAETDPGRAYQLNQKLTRHLNRKERNIKKQQGIESLSLPANKYRTIVIDPPWRIDKISREERMNQFDLDYPTMTLDQIMSLPIPDLASEDGCHIYLWATHKHLPDAFDILETWGAKYQCLLTWVKNVGMTPFSWMYSTEHCLFARIGNLDLLKMGKRLDFNGKVREHSRKPDEFYDRVKEVSPEPRIDMFGREKHDGFEVWGNEPAKFKPSVSVEVK